MSGILFSQMEPPPEWEDEFHDWYNTEHIPVRLALPGFERARRYEAISGSPRFLAVYELSDLSVFSTSIFRLLKTNPSDRTRRMLSKVGGFTRYVGSRIAGPDTLRAGAFLSVNAFKVPATHEPAFNDWYDSEHAPRLLAAADWLAVRRYEVVDGDDNAWTHLALHELASAEVMDSPERRHARTGSKRDALVGQPWFDNSGRWLYRLIFEQSKDG